MFKKLLMVFVLVLSLGVTTSAFAATTTSVLPPNGVQTYNDFGQQIRLDILTSGTNASQFKIYWAAGYNATSGFQSYYVSATPNETISNNQSAVGTEFQVPAIGWYTVWVVSVGADGKTSTAFKTNVNVLR